MVSAAADLLGAGNRRAGLVTLGILACGALLLPMLLLIVFAADGDVGSAVLGLTLGLILDLLALVLLMGVVTHKLTSRRQSTLARSLEKLATRTADLETAYQTSRAEQSETLARQTAAIAATPDRRPRCGYRRRQPPPGDAQPVRPRSAPGPGAPDGELCRRP